jgi:hypothetical protein
MGAKIVCENNVGVNVENWLLETEKWRKNITLLSSKPSV